jgi:hypothetical protein
LQLIRKTTSRSNEKSERHPLGVQWPPIQNVHEGGWESIGSSCM